MASLFNVLINVFGSLMLQPGSRQWDALVHRLRGHIQDLKSALVPWDGKDMMPLLSIGELKRKSTWFESGTIRTGSIATIYQESVVAICECTLNKGSKVALAQTSKYEFVYRMRERDVEIWVNSQPFGVFSGGSLLASGRGSRLLAQIQPGSDDRNLPVVMGTQTVLTLTNPKYPPASPNPRAILLLRDLQPEEEVAALALIILYQLRNV
jgi:hypothetical protein